MPDIKNKVYLHSLAFKKNEGVDEEAGIVHGYVIAETGVFREPDPRGQFNLKSLQRIKELMNADSDGMRVNLDHESMFGESNLLRYLGRVKNIRLDGKKLRGDLHFNETAAMLPGLGDVKTYLMRRIMSDPGSISSSLVITELDFDETAKGDPPTWMPMAIESSDIVSRGAAVGAILSSEAAKEMTAATPRLDKRRQKLDDMAYAMRKRLAS